MRSQTSPIPVRLHQRWFFPGELAACEYCGAAGHAVAPTCDGGRITPQLVDSPVGSGNVTASGPRTRRYGRNVFEPRRSQSGQCGEGGWGAVYAVDHGGVRCARGRAKKRRSPLVPALHAQRPWFRQERDRTIRFGRFEGVGIHRRSCDPRAALQRGARRDGERPDDSGDAWVRSSRRDASPLGPRYRH